MKFTIANSVEVNERTRAVEIDGVPIPHFTHIDMKREPFGEPSDGAEIVWIGILVDPNDDYVWEYEED